GASSGWWWDCDSCDSYLARGWLGGGRVGVEAWAGDRSPWADDKSGVPAAPACALRFSQPFLGGPLPRGPVVGPPVDVLDVESILCEHRLVAVRGLEQLVVGPGRLRLGALG